MNFSSALWVLQLLLLASASNAEFPHYHTAGDILHWFSHNAVKRADLMRFEEESQGSQPRMPVASITGPGDSSQRPVAILVFGEHAREIITTEVGLWMSKLLLGEGQEMLDWDHTKLVLKDVFGVAPEDVVSTVGCWVQDILGSMMLKILPIENMGGRLNWEKGELCLRKTETGVDLNRNWGYAWMKEDKDSEIYGGPEPFSEPQSRHVKEMAEALKPRAFVNVHSGEWAVYTGWDSKAALAPNMPGDLVLLMATLGDVCKCTSGPAGAVSGYLAYGTGMDYMHRELKVPYSITMEVGGSRFGLLRQGQSNKPLDSFSILPDDRRRHLRGVGGMFRDMPYRRGHRSRRSSEESNGVDEIQELVNNNAQARSQRNCFAMFNPNTYPEYQKSVSTWVIALLHTLRHVGNSSHPLPSIESTQ